MNISGDKVMIELLMHRSEAVAGQSVKGAVHVKKSFFHHGGIAIRIRGTERVTITGKAQSTIDFFYQEKIIRAEDDAFYICQIVRTGEKWLAFEFSFDLPADAPITSRVSSKNGSAERFYHIEALPLYPFSAPTEIVRFTVAHQGGLNVFEQYQAHRLEPYAVLSSHGSKILLQYCGRINLGFAVKRRDTEVEEYPWLTVHGSNHSISNITNTTVRLTETLTVKAQEHQATLYTRDLVNLSELDAAWHDETNELHTTTVPLVIPDNALASYASSLIEIRHQIWIEADTDGRAMTSPRSSKRKLTIAHDDRFLSEKRSSLVQLGNSPFADADAIEVFSEPTNAPESETVVDTIQAFALNPIFSHPIMSRSSRGMEFEHAILPPAHNIGTAGDGRRSARATADAEDNPSIARQRRPRRRESLRATPEFWSYR